MKRLNNFLLLIFILFISINNNYLYGKTKIFSVNNPLGKSAFFKQNLKVEKPYKVKDNIDLFKKILIGNWEGPPHSGYSFSGDGTFKMGYHELGKKYKKKGFWKVNENDILLKFNGEKEWKSYEVKEYIMYSESNIKFKYSIVIELNKGLPYADVLIIYFN